MLPSVDLFARSSAHPQNFLLLLLSPDSSPSIAPPRQPCHFYHLCWPCRIKIQFRGLNQFVLVLVPNTGSHQLAHFKSLGHSRKSIIFIVVIIINYVCDVVVISENKFWTHRHHPELITKSYPKDLFGLTSLAGFDIVAGFGVICTAEILEDELEELD